MIGTTRPELFGSVEALFLDAALDPDLWPVALGAFAGAGGSEASLFMTARSATQLGAPSAGFEEIIEAATADGWPQRNPRFPRINARTWTNFVCDTELLSADEIARDPFYNELLRPFGLKWAAGSILLSSPTLGPVVLTLERALDTDPFTPAELAALDSLRPSFARAVRLAESLGFRKLDGMIEGWEAAEVAGAILGSQGTVLRSTGALTALLGDGLALLGGIFAAAYMTTGSEVRRSVTTTTYTAVCYSTTALLLLVSCLVGGQAVAGYDGRDWVKLLALTAGAQLLGHSLFNLVLRRVSPTVVSLSILFEIPGAAVIAALFVKGQHVPLLALPAGALLVAGLAIVIRSGERESAPVE